jgi:1,4-dihydroxy-2-naphthoate octaprenyltransferase
MLSKSTLLHLRIPFSYFLLPVFLFALAVSPNLLKPRMTWVFIILHLLVYPASNGYNSYFDRDEKSIGGLKHPPPVTKDLYWTSLAFDALALVFAFIYVSPLFMIMVLIYGLASKAYSHPSVRLKKYAITGWLITGFFQGLFTFLTCYLALNEFDLESAWLAQALIPASLTSVMLWANYPMTQVYQHEEDALHGDMTISRKLGIRGTFLFTAAVFGMAVVGFVGYFLRYYQPRQAMAFLLALLPVLIYFGLWFVGVWRDPRRADHHRAMVLNFTSSTCLSAFFIWLLFDTRNVGRYLFD